MTENVPGALIVITSVFVTIVIIAQDILCKIVTPFVHQIMLKYLFEMCKGWELRILFISHTGRLYRRQRRRRG